MSCFPGTENRGAGLRLTLSCLYYGRSKIHVTIITCSGLIVLPLPSYQRNKSQATKKSGVRETISNQSNGKLQDTTKRYLRTSNLSAFVSLRVILLADSFVDNDLHSSVVTQSTIPRTQHHSGVQQTTLVDGGILGNIILLVVCRHYDLISTELAE